MLRTTRITLVTGLLLALAGSAAAASPKNVIVMIADGCGFNQITAAGYWANGKLNAEPYRQPGWVNLAMSTWSADGHGYDPLKAWAGPDYLKQQPTDSAAAATTMATGVKTYNAAIGVDKQRQPLVTLTEVAERLGKSSGVITSVPLSHATPAGFCAHNVSRNNYAELGQEMIDRSALDVIMGAGHPDYDDNNQLREKKDYRYVGGEELWTAAKAGTAGGDADGDGQVDAWTLIESREQFEQVAAGKLEPKRLLGVARVASTLQQGRAKDKAHNDDVPTLSTMALGAIRTLAANPKGFFLMIEGGAVDWACHANQADRMVQEETDFNQAVAAVVAWVEANGGWDKNLVVVTGDHETGYVTAANQTVPDAAQPLAATAQGALPAVAFNSGGHTNSLIPFAARGAGAQRYLDMAVLDDPVRGKYLDNTDLPRVIRELWGLGRALPAGAPLGDPVQAGEARVQRGNGTELPYRLYKPAYYDATRSYPLVIFLHGSGGRGTDNAQQVMDQPNGLLSLLSAQNRLQHPAFVLAPQCPPGSRWVNARWDQGGYSTAAIPISRHLQLVLDVLQATRHEFNIDANRLYVTGVSMGGYGTWDLISRHPELFAAAVPVCGAGDPSSAPAIAKVPVWAFHGAKDGAVPVSGSRDMIAAMKAAGGEPRYTEYPNAGHDSWYAAYSTPGLWDWLFEQQRAANQQQEETSNE